MGRRSVCLSWSPVSHRQQQQPPETLLLLQVTYSLECAADLRRQWHLRGRRWHNLPSTTAQR